MKKKNVHPRVFLSVLSHKMCQKVADFSHVVEVIGSSQQQQVVTGIFYCQRRRLTVTDQRRYKQYRFVGGKGQTSRVGCADQRIRRSRLRSVGSDVGARTIRSRCESTGPRGSHNAQWTATCARYSAHQRSVVEGSAAAPVQKYTSSLPDGKFCVVCCGG